MASQLIYNGITYNISDSEADVIRSLLQKLVDGPPLAGSFQISVTHEGRWHRLFVTVGCPITLVD